MSATCRRKLVGLSGNFDLQRRTPMKRFLSLSSMRLAFEVILISMLLVAAVSQSINTRAASPGAPEAPNAQYWYICNPPNHVAVFLDRVHVFCTTTSIVVGGTPALDSNIFWFAFPTAPDSASASRFMSLLQTSLITGRSIWLLVDPNDTSGSVFGCGGANCRRIYAVEMR